MLPTTNLTSYHGKTPINGRRRNCHQLSALCNCQCYPVITAVHGRPPTRFIGRGSAALIKYIRGAGCHAFNRFSAIHFKTVCFDTPFLIAYFVALR